MKCIFEAMFLGSHSGTKENGEIYYYGNFMDKESKKTYNLYFPDSTYFKNFVDTNWYKIPVVITFSSIVNKDNKRVTILKMSPDLEAFNK